MSDADLNAQVDHWLTTVANPRIHGTTGAVPAVRFLSEEQAHLQPLPARVYQSLVLTRGPRRRRSPGRCLRSWSSGAVSGPMPPWWERKDEPPHCHQPLGP